MEAQTDSKQPIRKRNRVSVASNNSNSSNPSNSKPGLSAKEKKMQQQSSNELGRGSLVWAHVQGHPWWPALVSLEQIAKSLNWSIWIFFPVFFFPILKTIARWTGTQG